MAKLLHAALEQNEQARNSVAVTFYFDSPPTAAEVHDACLNQRGKLPLSVDVDDPYYGYTEEPTPASRAAGQVRVQGHPTC